MSRARCAAAPPRRRACRRGEGRGRGGTRGCAGVPAPPATASGSREMSCSRARLPPPTSPRARMSLSARPTPPFGPHPAVRRGRRGAGRSRPLALASAPRGHHLRRHAGRDARRRMGSLPSLLPEGGGDLGAQLGHRRGRAEGSALVGTAQKSGAEALPRNQGPRSGKQGRGRSGTLDHPATPPASPMPRPRPGAAPAYTATPPVAPRPHPPGTLPPLPPSGSARATHPCIRVVSPPPRRAPAWTAPLTPPPRLPSPTPRQLPRTPSPSRRSLAPRSPSGSPPAPARPTPPSTAIDPPSAAALGFGATGR